MQLKYPASTRSSIVPFSSDARPIDLATEHGRLEVLRILNSASISQEQLIASFVNSPQLHLLSTPTLSTGQSWQVNGDSEMSFSDPISSEQVNADTAPATCADRIMEAKDELLLLIEKFKSGISIECFESMFSNWERKYNDVLEGQMSEELLHSLNQIKMLCVSMTTQCFSSSGLTMNGQWYFFKEVVFVLFFHSLPQFA